MQQSSATAVALMRAVQSKRQAGWEGWRQQKRRQDRADDVVEMQQRVLQVKMTNVMRHRNPGGPCGRQGW